MSHELSFDGQGKAELILVNMGAWHHFGTIVQGAANAADAMAIACPWEALKLSLFAHAPCGSPQKHLQAKWSGKFFRTPSFAVFRSDTGAHIGTVGSGYEVIQPIHQFDYVDTLLKGSGYHYESAGALRGGSVVFVCARVGEIDVLGSGDITRTYLAFVNSFDGSLAAQVYLTGTRIVCMNTLQMSLGDAKNTLRFKHTRNVHAKLSSAQTLVASVTQTEATLKAKLETLAQRKINKKATLASVLDALFPGDKAKREVANLWGANDNDAFPEWKGTAYALYNAVTNYVDHQRTTKGDDKATARAESAILGSGAALKDKALGTILALTGDTIPDSVNAFLDAIDTTDGLD